MFTDPLLLLMSFKATQTDPTDANLLGKDCLAQIVSVAADNEH
jgi:hypothetical protein